MTEVRSPDTWSPILMTGSTNHHQEWRRGETNQNARHGVAWKRWGVLHTHSKLPSAGQQGAPGFAQGTFPSWDSAGHLSLPQGPALCEKRL